MLWLAHIPVQVGVETNLTCVVDQKLLCVRIRYRDHGSSALHWKLSSLPLISLMIDSIVNLRTGETSAFIVDGPTDYILLMQTLAKCSYYALENTGAFQIM